MIRKTTAAVADLIDKEEWSSLGTDVKGDGYEGLLQKNAEDVKGVAEGGLRAEPEVCGL